MKKNINKALGFALALAIGSSIAVAPAMAAKVACMPDADGKVEYKDKITDCPEYGSVDNKDLDLSSTATNIINIIIGIVGFIAVVMIIIGGISYSTSAGDAGKVKKAKDTIMYGIIGLVVAILAFAIVNFVLGGIQSASTGP